MTRSVGEPPTDSLGEVPTYLPYNQHKELFSSKVDDVKWSKGDEFHYWDIALEKQRRFRCFGFEFLSVHTTRSWGSWVAVQDVKFWETGE